MTILTPSRSASSFSFPEEVRSSKRSPTKAGVPKVRERLVLTDLFVTKALNTAGRQNAQPFSALNELHQIKLVTDLTYTDGGQTGGGWSAILRVKLLTGGDFTSYMTDTTKQAAKKLAAEDCLNQVKNAIRQYAFDPWPVQMPEISHEPITGSATVTARQQQQLDMDQTHLHVLQQMDEQRKARNRAVTFLSIDVETYDQTNRDLLEVGVSWVAAGDAWDHHHIQTRHFIIEDNLHLQNGKFCPNHREGFNFGTSEIIGVAQMPSTVSAILNTIKSTTPSIYLVGHGPDQDLQWLADAQLEVVTTDFVVCDIARVYRAWSSKGQYSNTASLEDMMQRLQVPCANLHNGGNDARYHLEVALRLMTV